MLPAGFTELLRDRSGGWMDGRTDSSPGKNHGSKAHPPNGDHQEHHPPVIPGHCTGPLGTGPQNDRQQRLLVASRLSRHSTDTPSYKTCPGKGSSSWDFGISLSQVPEGKR